MQPADTRSLQAAYVLHRRPFRDTSLLLDLFVRDRGRVPCVARGAQGNRRLAPLLQPFQALQVTLRGTGEVLTLAGADVGAPALALSGQRLYCGIYLNELLLKLTARDDPSPGLYDRYASTLRALADHEALEPTLRRFEYSLLAELGLGLSLDHDSTGAPIDVHRRYNYTVESGAIPIHDTGTGGTSGKTLIALRTGEFDDPQILRDVRSLMRNVLDYHLDGRALRSRDLFRPSS